MARRPSGTGALVAGVVLGALGVFAVAVVAPWASRDELRFASVPSPPSLLELGIVPVAPGEAACTRPFVIDGGHAQATFRILTYANPGPAVRVRITGRGYRSTARVAGGYADNLAHTVPMARPRGQTAAEACFRNAGTRPLALYAAGDSRSNTRSDSRVGERPVANDITLAFYESAPRSLRDRLPRTVERATRFRPAVVGPWLVWALLGLVLVGVPAAAAWAVGAAARADERDPGSS